VKEAYREGKKGRKVVKIKKLWKKYGTKTKTYIM